MTETKTAKTFEEKLNTEYVQRKIQDFIRVKEYTRLALKERAKYEMSREIGVDYQPSDAPEQVRDVCEIAFKNIDIGVSSTLCEGVESLPMEVAYKICKVLDAPGNTPAVPYVEGIILKYNLDPEAKARTGEPSL